MFEPKFGNASDCLLSTKTISPFIKSRLSYFFNSRWGAFIDLKIASATHSGKDVSTLIPDGYYNLGSFFDGNNNVVLFDGSVGGTYRIEKKNWIIRTRLGFGIGEMLAKNSDFNLKEKGGNNLYQIRYSAGDSETGTDDLLFLNPGISLGYKYRKILFNLDVDYTQFLQKVDYTYKVTDAYTREVIETKIMAPKNLSGKLGIGIGVSFNY
ncbi:hypothetical protein [Bacteroides sedimenti]|uniref:DUF3575 domain-containing protein n=1 Tax=Bacteroides sedimenti TaxID=2136147 RepID=A0ABN6ZDG0_9BACE